MFSLSASLRSCARAPPRPSLLPLQPRAARMASRRATQASRLVSRNEELAREESIVDELQDTTKLLDNAPVRMGPVSDSFSGQSPLSSPTVLPYRPLTSRTLSRHPERPPQVPQNPHSKRTSPATHCPPSLPLLTAAQFIKPTDFKDRSDDERIRRRRPLLGPDAAQSRQDDPFHLLGIDPLVEATNPKLLSYFVTEMGKVRGRAENRLTWHSQRRLTRAIRRAKNMGVIPTLSRSITLRNP